ncbi:MAG: hypothetical protein ACI9E1_001974 [Cryomorphaceae bacterium]|jgi:hypothetical protein
MKFNSLLKLNILKAGIIGLATVYLASCAGGPMAPSVQTPAFSNSDSSPVNELTAAKYPSIAGSKRMTQPKSTTQERPGLGTGWGDDVASAVNFTSFQRANVRPASIASIYYNDKEGIKAMTNSWNYSGKGLQKTANGMVEWGVKGNWGYLKNKHSSGKRFVVGSKNQTYSLVVKNLSKSRLELVMSVDGLDVLDGKPASTKKRGYIIQPGKTLTVKGFRKSAQAVAAFKFASVNSSYTNLSGKGTRNIGVIGMAVFTEKGVDPWKYGTAELRDRKNARAFAEAPQLRAR